MLQKRVKRLGGTQRKAIGRHAGTRSAAAHAAQEPHLASTGLQVKVRPHQCQCSCPRDFRSQPPTVLWGSSSSSGQSSWARLTAELLHSAVTEKQGLLQLRSASRRRKQKQAQSPYTEGDDSERDSPHSLDKVGSPHPGFCTAAPHQADAFDAVHRRCCAKLLLWRS